VRAKRASRASLRQGKTFRAGFPQARRLEARRAWLDGDPAAARTWWQRGMALAEELEIPYEIAMSGVDMARLASDQRHLSRSLELLAETGAVDDLAVARRLALATSTPDVA
jgi:hypothetical protein